MQRAIVREKLKVQQPDVYVDVEVDEFYVLDFHRLRQILAAAERAKEHLRRQLKRVLSSHTLEAHPAIPPPETPPSPSGRKRRLPRLKPLSREREA
jgi:NTE family protein